MASGSLVNSAIRVDKPHTVPVGRGTQSMMIDIDVGHNLFSSVVDMVWSSSSHGEVPHCHTPTDGGIIGARH